MTDSVVTDYLIKIKQNNELFRLQLNRVLSDVLNRIGDVYTPEQEGAAGDPSVNDTTDILNLIDAMPSTGGVMLLRKTYYVKALDLTKPVMVIGPGGFRNYDTSDTTSANYVLGLRANDITMWNASVTGAVSTTASPPATFAAVLAYADGSDNPYERARIFDCTLTGGRQTLSLSEAKSSWVTGNTITGGWDYNILGPVAGDRVWITENDITASYNNAGVRMGALTDAEPVRDLLIALNYFENCGLQLTQDAVDISTAVAERIAVYYNTVKNCGNGIELKVDTPHSGYNTSRMSGNIIVAETTSHRARIRVQFSGTIDQDHVNRILIDSNQIYTASNAILGGILTDANNDVTIRDNEVYGPSIPIRLDCIANGTMRRPVVTGNRTRGDYGVYISGETGANIDAAEITGNIIDATTTGIFCAETAGVGATLNDPNINDNTIRVSGTTPAMQLSGVSNGEIADNKIRGAGKGIVFSGSQANAGTTAITGNSGRTASDAIQINAATGTFEINDNKIRSTNGRGVLDSAAGATTLAGGNCRGVSAAIPTVAGGLGDFFWDASPAAGATKWVCTTAGAAGVAVWTAQ